MYGRYAYRGALIGLLIAIGYDTSASTAALEGGRRHLSFGVVIFAALIGLGVGLVAAKIRAGQPKGSGPPPTA